MSEIQGLELTRRLNTDLERLNCLIGNHRSETSNGPARIILIGKASAEWMELGIEQKTYHIDVVLDLQETGERLVQIRQCMAQGGVFREFDRPQLDTKKAWRTFFGTSAHRATVFKDVSQKGRCVSGDKKHLKAYVMDTDRALEFELRRWAEPGSDKRTKEASLKIANALWDTSERGDELQTRSSCQDLRYIRCDAGVPVDSVKALQALRASRKAENVLRR